MLSPGCKLGDKESDLLITELINSDGTRQQMREGADAWFRLEGDIFSFLKKKALEERTTQVGGQKQEDIFVDFSFLFALFFLKPSPLPNLHYL